MKKITLSVALLLSGYVAKAQTEYVDITTKGIFGRSEMVLYNDNTNYKDLEYFYLGRNSDKYHWVKYTNANKVVVTMSDDVGDTRELCVKRNDQELQCEVVDAFATVYEFKASYKFEVWISKTNVK